MNWERGYSSGARHKTFYAKIDNKTVCNISCIKHIETWDIIINAWNTSNYTFRWFRRFHQKNVLAKVEEQIQNVNAAKFAVFNRLFEGPKQ